MTKTKPETYLPNLEKGRERKIKGRVYMFDKFTVETGSNGCLLIIDDKQQKFDLFQAATLRNQLSEWINAERQRNSRTSTSS